jgi:hypothetical protein
MFSRMRIAGASLLAAAAVGAPLLATAQPMPASFASGSISERVVRSQNGERERMGLRDLVWDPTLAAAAASYADELAATGKWQHSAPETRVGQGENLWMGTHAAFSPEEMVGDWIAERKLFRSGTFPNVSSSGSWHDVGHYTQLIWPATNRVGCAVRSSAEYDYLVCRYSGPGNVMGDRVGPMTLASR